MNALQGTGRLEGARVIITAAASGMGRAGCELFAREGARVAAIDRDVAGLHDLTKLIEERGGKVKAISADLLDERQAVECIQSAKSWLGGIDALWSHAGMPAPADIVELDLNQYRRSADLNLTAAVIVCGQSLQTMREQRSGSIVLTSSTSDLVGSALSPLYSGLKAGVVGLAKGLAVRYAAEGIRVNALCPGPIATPMLYNDFMKVDARFTQQENEARVLSAVPMGRMGQPMEVAQAALWLCSNESGYVTGIALPVDGGLTAR
jgi:NAD(P)-dependent dehydrogenase (short-subunit alcohol dehydrogenase family)